MAKFHVRTSIPVANGQPSNKVFWRTNIGEQSAGVRRELKNDDEKEKAMKKLLRIHQSSGMHWVGNGFPVRSVFDYNGLARELSPFLLLDYATPYEFAPGDERRGVGAHPHKGFETVTVAYQGELEHRDSSGGGGKIGAGDVQWMTAGKGIVHEEFHSADFTRKGGTLQMVQLWVNLRAKDKSAKPGYQTLLSAHIPSVSLPQDAGAVRVIAGEFVGRKGPAKTFTPINLWDVNLRAGKSAELPLPDGHTTAVLVLSGKVRVDGDREANEGDLAIFVRSGEGITVEATTDAKLLVMDGEPIEEPVVGHGPFVMNSRAEIQQAFEDYQLGRMGELV
jgi:redox-sensitive bicupin YhaK (pirin superfamily)